MRILLASIFLLAVAGCVDQHAEVQTYRDVVDANRPHPAAYENPSPLSLTRALALANQDNEDISLQGENYLQALIAKNRAVAAFLPTVSLQPSFAIEQQPQIGSTPANPITPALVAASAESSGYVNSHGTWHSVQVPVVGQFNFTPSSFGNLQSANETIEQQKQLLLDAQATVLINVAQTYYQILRSERQVDVLKDTVALDDARLADVVQRFNNKLALALEVSQTKAQLASEQVDLTQAQTDVANGRHTLAYLIGVCSVDGPLSDDCSVPDDLPDVDAWVRTGLATRQDLLAAAANVRSARASVDAAIAQYYPSVSLDISGFLYREYFADASKWYALLQANLPIFSAGIIEADVRTAWSKLRQAALYESELRRQIEQNTRTAYTNLIAADQTLVELREEVQAASDALSQSEQLEHNGLAIPLDVLTARDTLLNAQLLQAGEEFDRTVFYLDLLRTAGTLTPDAATNWHPTTQP